VRSVLWPKDMHQMLGTKVPSLTFVNNTMMTLGRTWIVVLDDSRARFLTREASGTLTETAPELRLDPHAQANAGSDARRQQREKFIQGIVRTLDHACDGGACDRIMLIGPERMLSTMRKSASDKIRARLWREMAAEVDVSSESDLAGRLQPHFK
jgi:hypothetical protein